MIRGNHPAHQTSDDMALDQVTFTHVHSTANPPSFNKTQNDDAANHHKDVVTSNSNSLPPSPSPSVILFLQFLRFNSLLTQSTKLLSLVEGCDYEHWLVVMEAPKGYPLRDEIFDGYVVTLAMALGGEEEAKKSIYSVSTRYYCAFGCNVPDNFTYKIKSLPIVKWVLPDSYLSYDECSYGGEAFINGEVVPYDDKYHRDWIQDHNDEQQRRLSTYPT